MLTRERNYRPPIRLNENETEIFLKKVEKSKLTIQEYGLKSLLDKDIIVVEGILELAMQIQKIGVNINQIVHLANADQKVSENEIRNLSNKLKEVMKLLNNFVTSVKK